METSSTTDEQNRSPESTRSTLQAARVKQFMNILEQLPRLCSPTICGTLSQPTTRAERMSRGGDAFEWSLEQKAILSPANITTDTEGTDELQHNLADLNQTWRQQESEQFFSQRTIAPSPLVRTPTSKNGFKRPAPVRYDDLMYEEDEEEEEDEREDDDDDVADEDEYDYDVGPRANARVITTPKHDDSDTEFDYEDDDNADKGNDHSTDAEDDEEADYLDSNRMDEDSDDYDDDEDADDDDKDDNDDKDSDATDRDNDGQQEDGDNLFFSPQPLRSSQTQQRVDIFSPESFGRVMEDENTLQSTPKTTGSLLPRSRTRTRQDMLD